MNTLIKHRGFSIQPAIFTTHKIMSPRAISQAIKQRDSKNMDTSKLKILVVEDDPISQRVAQLMVEASRYEVDIAATGKEALGLFLKNHYALILMDYGLPDLTGVQITRLMREIEQTKGGHTPIIALTAHSELAKQACLEAGMDDFTTKPINLETFNRLICHWIEKLK